MQRQGFRDYSNAGGKERETYRLMHQNQTSSFVDSMHEQYSRPDGYVDAYKGKPEFTLDEIPAILDTIIDESDPDTDQKQIIHAYQACEALREYLDPQDQTKLRPDISVRQLFSEKQWRQLPYKYKKMYSCNLHELYPHIQDWSWLPLVGFLHDCGKVLATEAWGQNPQWAVVGDTFPVKAPFSKQNVYANQGFFKTNTSVNMRNNHIRTFGAYNRNCGFDQTQMSWGHDEYFYRVLKRTESMLPEEALYIIRYHSFYPWHTPRSGKQGYKQLANERDWLLLPLLKAFQRSDLYSKKADIPDQDKLREYCQQLVAKYFTDKKENQLLRMKW